MRQRLHRFFTSPRLTYWNAGLCAAAIATNLFDQVFCRPVLWATITLFIAFAPVILYPLLRSRLDRWRTRVHFLFGIAACICLYCILFLGRMHLAIPLVAFLRPYAIFGYLPLFLLIQIIYHARTTSGSFKPFASGVLLCIVFAVCMGIWFHRSFDRVNAALNDPGQASLVTPNYMTELMLGMHVKYHVSFCAYDGWRPPLHDPSVVVAAWLNIPFHEDPNRKTYRSDILCPPPLFHGGDRAVVYNSRIAAYKSLFPDNDLWQSCSCAYAYSEDYFEDAERQGGR